MTTSQFIHEPMTSPTRPGLSFSPTARLWNGPIQAGAALPPLVTLITKEAGGPMAIHWLSTPAIGVGISDLKLQSYQQRITNW